MSGGEPQREERRRSAGRPCTVCSDPRLTEIHAALDGAGRPRLSINQAAAKFGLPPTNLKRHIKAHRGPLPHLDPIRSVLGQRRGARAAGGKSCPVCRHPQRKEIEDRLLTNGSLVAVWREFGKKVPRGGIKADPTGLPLISRTSLRSHRDVCLREYLVGCSQRIAEGITGVARAKCLELVRKLEGLSDRLHEQSNGGLLTGKRLEDFLRTVRELRAAVELLGRLTGEIRPDLSVNMILASPDFARVRQALVDALLPFGPGVLEAAAAALEGIDGPRVETPVLVVAPNAKIAAA